MSSMAFLSRGHQARGNLAVAAVTFTSSLVVAARLRETPA
jgi:hypothetical protein